MDLKSKFLRIYANLPLNQRSEIVVVIDDEPLTWNSAKIEIENYTDKGQEILDKLIKMGIQELRGSGCRKPIISYRFL